MRTTITASIAGMLQLVMSLSERLGVWHYHPKVHDKCIIDIASHNKTEHTQNISHMTNMSNCIIFTTLHTHTKWACGIHTKYLLQYHTFVSMFVHSEGGEVYLHNLFTQRVWGNHYIILWTVLTNRRHCIELSVQTNCHLLHPHYIIVK